MVKSHCPGSVSYTHLDVYKRQDELCQDNIQLMVLGTGEEQYENMFRHFAWKYPGKVSAQIYYSEAVSHRVYASCDAFLMPSLFEPCGLSQLIALRYGTAVSYTHLDVYKRQAYNGS